MTKLQLTIQTGTYESVRAIRDGTVKPEGIDLVFPEFPGTRELHGRVQAGAYDIGEYNAAAYMANRSRNQLMTALPIYLHRRFRHGFIFINTAKGIRGPKDLAGTRIGCTNFAPAAVVWMRGVLENEYGVPHRSITWVTERDEDGTFDYHPELKIERIAKGQDLEEMLATGELDAMIAPDVVRAVLDGDKRVARLFPNYKDLEIESYARTGLFPIMHVTVIRQDIVDKNPWVVRSLMDAFEEAKQIAYKRLENPRIVPLVWYQTALEEQRALLGRDPWAYGLGEVEKKNLRTMAMYSAQQGLTDREMPLEELFPRDAFGWTPRAQASAG